MRKLILMIAIAVVTSLALAQAAFAQQGGAQTYTADLAPLNGSGSSGTATVTASGNQLTVNLTTQGAVPNAPHAQHIHIGGQNVCPTPAADANGDGLVSTPEGQPAYGPIEVSFTTTGDVSTESGMAVDRFPVADANGTVTYSRTFKLPSDVSPDQIANGVIVQHGVDANGSGKYDGPASPAGPPVEATLPAVCGKLVAASGGGALPTTSGPSPLALALSGGAALISLGLVGGYLARRRSA